MFEVRKFQVWEHHTEMQAPATSTEGLICIVLATYLQAKPPSCLGTSGFLQGLLRPEANS